MAYTNITQKELVRLLKEELQEAENDSLVKELLKICSKEIKLWDGNIGEGNELRALYKTLNNYEF